MAIAEPFVSEFTRQTKPRRGALLAIVVGGYWGVWGSQGVPSPSLHKSARDIRQKRHHTVIINLSLFPWKALCVWTMQYKYCQHTQRQTYTLKHLAIYILQVYLKLYLNFYLHIQFCSAIWNLKSLWNVGFKQIK